MKTPMTGPDCKTAKRQAAERRGQWAEIIAALLLLAKGYRIAGRRVRTKAGEIDLIARRGTVTLFCEIKARKTIEAGLKAISRTQQNRIERAALLWLQAQHQAPGRCRFDVICVAFPFRLRHIKGAWHPRTLP